MVELGVTANTVNDSVTVELLLDDAGVLLGVEDGLLGHVLEVEDFEDLARGLVHQGLLVGAGHHYNKKRY